MIDEKEEAILRKYAMWQPYIKAHSNKVDPSDLQNVCLGCSGSGCAACGG